MIKSIEYYINDMEEQDIRTAPSIDLPPLKVEKFYLPKDGGRFMLLACDTDDLWAPTKCPYCGCTELIKDSRSDFRVVRDIPRNNYSVNILLKSRVYKCKENGHRFVPPIDGLKEGTQMTTRLDEYIRTECFFQSFASLAERTGYSVDYIAKVLAQEADKKEAERAKHPFEAPYALGIDEKHIVKKMRGILVDTDKGILLDMTEKNSAEQFQAAIKKLAHWDTNIKVVTTDMANAYLSWLPKFLPNAKIVIDKFHVMQDVNHKVSAAKIVLYEFRKALIKNIEDKEEQTRQATILKYLANDNRLFNYSSATLKKDKTGKDKKIAEIVSNFPEFALLKRLGSLPEQMYKQTTWDDAKKVWDTWQSELPPNGRKAYEAWCKEHELPVNAFLEFKKLSSRNFKRFEPYILNYFLPGCAYTNGTTEGINNLIGRINSQGNGYSFNSLRAKSLWASSIGERKQYGFNVKGMKMWKTKDGLMLYTSPNAGRDLISVTIPAFEFFTKKYSANIPTRLIYTVDGVEMLFETYEDEAFPKFKATKSEAKELYTRRKKSALSTLIDNTTSD